jgi:hypothetical protein
MNPSERKIAKPASGGESMSMYGDDRSAVFDVLDRLVGKADEQEFA